MVYFVKNNLPLSSIHFIIFHGSIHELPEEKGISHFLEHLLCHNLDDYYSTLYENGINFNAYTSSGHVVFHLDGLEEDLLKVYPLFKNIFKFEYSEERIEEEREVILQEYYQGFSSLSANHFYQVFQNEFNVCPPIGTDRSISGLTKKMLENRFKESFSAPNKIIIISQNPNKFNDFGALPETIEKEHVKNKSPWDKITWKNKEKESVSFLLYGEKVNEYNPAIDFLCSYYNSGLNSPFFTELRQKYGLFYSISPFNMDLEYDRANTRLIVTGETTKDKIDLFLEKFFDLVENFNLDTNQERFKEVFNYYDKSYEKHKVLNYSSIDEYLIPEKYLWENYKKFINFESLTFANEYFKKLNVSLSSDFN